MAIGAALFGLTVALATRERLSRPDPALTTYLEAQFILGHRLRLLKMQDGSGSDGRR